MSGWVYGFPHTARCGLEADQSAQHSWPWQLHLYNSKTVMKQSYIGCICIDSLLILREIEKRKFGFSATRLDKPKQFLLFILLLFGFYFPLLFSRSYPVPLLLSPLLFSIAFISQILLLFYSYSSSPVCVSVCACMCPCVHVCACTCVHACMRVCMCVHLCVCTGACMHVCVYVCCTCIHCYRWNSALCVLNKVHMPCISSLNFVTHHDGSSSLVVPGFIFNV